METDHKKKFKPCHLDYPIFSLLHFLKSKNKLSDIPMLCVKQAEHFSWNLVQAMSLEYISKPCAIVFYSHRWTCKYMNVWGGKYLLC